MAEPTILDKRINKLITATGRSSMWLWMRVEHGLRQVLGVIKRQRTNLTSECLYRAASYPVASNQPSFLETNGSIEDCTLNPIRPNILPLTLILLRKRQTVYMVSDEEPTRWVTIKPAHLVKLTEKSRLILLGV